MKLVVSMLMQSLIDVASTEEIPPKINVRTKIDLFLGVDPLTSIF